MQRGCTFLLLNTNTKIIQGKVFLVMEGRDIMEEYLEINKEMVEKFPFSKTKLVVIMGNNAL